MTLKFGQVGFKAYALLSLSLKKKPVAYADVQISGYIDHFFVSGSCARQGVGTMLMQRILETATARNISVLTSDVSRTAQPFFARFGFVIVEQRATVALPNALMRREVAQVLGRSSARATTQ